MSRIRQPYSIIKRQDSPHYFFKLGNWRQYRSTGTTSPEEAEQIAQAAYLQSLTVPRGPTLREYAEPYFVWESCPHVRRLLGEGKSIEHRHVSNMRRMIQNHLFTDPIANIRLPELKRAHILDFRDRLLDKLGFTRTVQMTMSGLKTILKEAYFREEIERDPTEGVGNTRYDAEDTGIFTGEELKQLFPLRIPGPWTSLLSYAVFLTAAVTGMRRGEILALEWQHISFMRSCISVRQAWKDIEVLGDPKWGKVRTTPLPESLLTALMLVRGTKLEVYADDLVFSYPDGRRLGGTWWQKNFRAGMEAAGIDYEGRHIKAHSFRHTLNSLLRERSYDADKIRASMGWSSTDVQDGYTHWSAASFDGQREIIDSLFN